MANSRFTFTPYSAEFPDSDFPQLQLVSRRPVLSFDDTVPEMCYWTARAPQGLTGTIKVYIQYIMASATSGKVDFEVAIEAVTPGDSVDLDAGDSFDSVNGASETVPGTAGYLGELEITISNDDSIAAGDYFRLRLERDADDGANDTAPGDCHVLQVELRDDA